MNLLVRCDRLPPAPTRRSLGSFVISSPFHIYAVVVQILLYSSSVYINDELTDRKSVV